MEGSWGTFEDRDFGGWEPPLGLMKPCVWHKGGPWRAGLLASRKGPGPEASTLKSPAASLLRRRVRILSAALGL